MIAQLSTINLKCDHCIKTVMPKFRIEQSRYHAAMTGGADIAAQYYALDVFERMKRQAKKEGVYFIKKELDMQALANYTNAYIELMLKYETICHECTLTRIEQTERTLSKYKSCIEHKTNKLKEKVIAQ